MVDTRGRTGWASFRAAWRRCLIFQTAKAWASPPSECTRCNLQVSEGERSCHDQNKGEPSQYAEYGGEQPVVSTSPGGRVESIGIGIVGSPASPLLRHGSWQSLKKVSGETNALRNCWAEKIPPLVWAPRLLYRRLFIGPSIGGEETWWSMMVHPGAIVNSAKGDHGRSWWPKSVQKEGLAGVRSIELFLGRQAVVPSDTVYFSVRGEYEWQCCVSCVQ